MLQHHSASDRDHGPDADRQRVIVFPLVQVRFLPSLGQMLRGILLVILGAGACLVWREEGVLFPTSFEDTQVANRAFIVSGKNYSARSSNQATGSAVMALNSLEDITSSSSSPRAEPPKSLADQKANRGEKGQPDIVSPLNSGNATSSPSPLPRKDDEEQLEPMPALPSSTFRQYGGAKSVLLCPFPKDEEGDGKERADSFPCRECSSRGGLPNVMARIQEGQSVKVCYFGGSVTAGPNYREAATDALQAMYPGSEWIEKNAGVRATGSELGACRLHHDVLPFEPDLLIIEFAINDDGFHGVDNKYEEIQQAMENIVRTFWSHLPNSDILFLYTIRQQEMSFYEEGTFSPAASVHEAVARHYDIPSIHVGLKIARMAVEGKVIWQDELPKTPEGFAASKGKFIFGRDGVHPHPSTGGEKYIEAFERGFRTIETVTAKSSQTLAAHISKLPSAMTPSNAGGVAMILPENEMMILSANARPLTSEDPLMGIIDHNFPMIPSKYVAHTPGDRFTLSFHGTGIGLYAVVGPMSGDMVVTLDDGEPQPVTIFTSFCSMTRPGYFPLATTLPEGKHKITLDISPKVPEKDKIFNGKNSSLIQATKQDTTYVFAAFCVRGGYEVGRALPSL